MTDSDSVATNDLKERIRNYPDFPKPGILFRDIFSVLKEPESFRSLRDILVNYIRKHIPQTEVIAGLESRGFLFGTVIALELGVPFVPIRKKGKLPGEVKQVTYTLEYGSDAFEAQSDSIRSGQKVLLVDDLLATGGSLKASCQLVEALGGEVSGCLVVMELCDLKGRDNVPATVHSIIQF